MVFQDRNRNCSGHQSNGSFHEKKQCSILFYKIGIDLLYTFCLVFIFLRCLACLIYVNEEKQQMHYTCTQFTKNCALLKILILFIHAFNSIPMERVLLIAVHPVEFSTDMKLLQPCSVCFPVLLPSSQCSISTSGVQVSSRGVLSG